MPYPVAAARGARTPPPSAAVLHLTSNGGFSTAEISVAENTTAVTTVKAVAGTAPYTYSKSGTDHAKFDIDASTGVLAFHDAPDYETPTDANTDNVYLVTVTVTDDAAATDSQSIRVTVTNAPEIVISSNGGGATADVDVAENQTAVTTVTATGSVVAVVFSISGGADAALFAIDATTGVLTFLTAPDFETPTDDDEDGVYEVEVTATEGASSDMQAINVTVTDVVE